MKKELNLQELIKQKKQLVSITKELDKYVMDLMGRKRTLMDNIDALTKQHIEPLTEELSIIESDLESYIRETGVDGISHPRLTCIIDPAAMHVEIKDMEKALAFVSKYPHILKKDILKTAEVAELIAQGTVPDPDTDGIDANGTYTKITYRKK